MGESRAITGLDRLPWLDDDRDVPRRRSSSGRAIGIVVLIVAVAILFYWLGTKSWTMFPPREAVQQNEANAPLPLPEPRALPEPEGFPAPIAESDPIPAVPIARPAEPPRRSVSERRKAVNAEAKRGVATAAEEDEAPRSSGLRDPWPVRKTEGAAGRLVHMGTFSSRGQAKRGWNALMRINPSLQRLPALVVPVRSQRNNKVYYRLQMGTTSQAHSVALCQRLRMIGQSCIVLADAVEKKAE